jgi:hypothetical protein
MTKISKDLSAGNLHSRENLYLAGNLGVLNAEVQVPCDGAATVALDLRGTFSMTVAVQGTVDGTNWVLIPVRPQTGGIYVLGIVGTTAGVWMASCVGFAKVRALVTSYTSGTAAAVLLASNGFFDDFAKNGGVTALLGTNTGAAAAAVTLTLAAPGVGLRHYLTYLRITRFASALLTAAATPVLVTTTNIPGTLVFSVPAEAAPQGSVFVYQEDFAFPLMTTAQNAATTIVCPVTTAVIWRVTAGYYVAP